MAEFKITIGDPATKRTYKIELRGDDANQLLGKKIQEKFRGEILNLTGYEFEITGGSDKAGFPMKKDIDGIGRRKLTLRSGAGYCEPKKFKGRLQKKSVRGNTISEDIVQVNCKVVKQGSESLDKIFPAKPKEEKPAEVPVV